MLTTLVSGSRAAQAPARRRPARPLMSTTGSAPSSRPADPDADRLLELGYPQELKRSLRGVDNVAMGFATISPVVGLYAVAFVGMTVAGPAWVWVMPLALAGQCLL